MVATPTIAAAGPPLCGALLFPVVPPDSASPSARASLRHHVCMAPPPSHLSPCLAHVRTDARLYLTAKRRSAVSDGGEDQGAEEVTVMGQKKAKKSSRQILERAVSHERLSLSARAVFLHSPACSGPSAVVHNRQFEDSRPNKTWNFGARDEGLETARTQRRHEVHPCGVRHGRRAVQRHEVVLRGTSAGAAVHVTTAP